MFAKQIRKIPIQFFVIFAIILAKLLQPHVTTHFKMISYSFSLILKDILVFILPALIISSIYKAIVSMRNYSIFFFPAIILFICGSNFLHVFGALNLADYLIDDIQGFSDVKSNQTLAAAWLFQIPKIITNEQALYIGFILGFIGYKKSFIPIEQLISFLSKASSFVLKKVFVPMLPVFIFGMAIKMINDGVVDVLIANLKLFSTMFEVLVVYLIVLLLIAAGFSFTRGYKIFVNIVPAVATALSSMSSAMALPLSLKAAAKNTESKGFSDFFMPATVNIHMIGDCIIIPFLMVIVIKIFGMQLPVEKIPLFALLFMVTKFSGAGVPGGTVFIMVPLMVKVFGFTPQMSMLITSMYIIIDPFATSISVMANNLFVIIFDKMLLSFNKTKVQDESSVYTK